MKTPFRQLWISLAISAFLLSPSMLKAKSTTPELPPVSKPTTVSTPSKPKSAPRFPKQPTVQRATPTTNKTLPTAKQPSPALKIRSGYCCINGKVTKSNEPDCRRKGGRFLLNSRSAQKICDAQPGYCCKEGNVSRSKQGTCKQNRGNFFLKQADAKKKCSGSRGFCYDKVKVTASSKGSCDQKKGKFFINKSDADALYAKLKGYCCVNGKVSRMNQKMCKKKKGQFSSNQQLATRACKTEKGFCCTNNKVHPSSRAMCEQKQGRFSTNRQKIIKNCTAGKSPRKMTAGVPEKARPKQIAAPSSFSLPIGQRRPLSPQVPSNLGRSQQFLGSTGKTLGRQNNLRERLPATESAPAKSIGTAKETFPGQMQPSLVTGPGAQRQGAVKETLIPIRSEESGFKIRIENSEDGSMNIYENLNIDEYEAFVSIFGSDLVQDEDRAQDTGVENGEGIGPEELMAIIMPAQNSDETSEEEVDPYPWNAGVFYGDDGSEDDGDTNTWNEGTVFGDDDDGTDDGSDTNSWNEGTVFGDDEDEEDEEYVDWFGEVEDDDDTDSDSTDSDSKDDDDDENSTGSTDNKTTVADDGSGDEGSDGSADPNRVKGSPTAGTTTFAPGEESGSEGGIDPGYFHDLGPTQIHTFDGSAATSHRFEDLNEGAQERVKEGIGTRSE